jgi:DNA-binding transcriptional ArsR family regulator
MSNYGKEDIENLAGVFGALSNPSRLSIFIRLSSCCVPGTQRPLDSTKMPEFVGQLGRELGIAPSTVSHHIKELRRAGLVRAGRCGKSVLCWVQQQTLFNLTRFFGQWIFNEAEIEQCCREDEETAGE